MNTATWVLSALRRLTIMIAIAIVFAFGLATTVFLSLRSPEVKVPDVVGKDRLEAERVLSAVGLNSRVRVNRPSSQMQADTVLFQLPKAGEVVKVGQTVAMDLSRPAKEGEASEAVIPEKSPEDKPSNQNTNEASSENANKPKPNKNTNKNANENTNTANRNANTNRAVVNNNANSGNANSATNLNANRSAVNGNTNSNRSGNQNATVHPPAAKPSPTVKPNRENP